MPDAATVAELMEMLRHAQQVTNAGSYVQDYVAGTIRWAPDAPLLFGLPPGCESMAFAEWRANRHPDDVARIDAEREAAFAALQTRTTYDYRIVRPDNGQIMHVEVRACREYDNAGRPLRGIGLVLDITERKQAEAILAENQTRLRAALAIAQISTFTWDIAAGELGADDRMSKLWGLPPGSTVPIDRFFQAVHPDDLPRLQADIAAALDPSGGGQFRGTYRITHPGSTHIRHMQANGVVTFHNGQPIRMIGASVDVTQLRHGQEALAREALELERLADERGKALEDSNARLAQAAKMEALGRLAGGIAHDFNNVLQAIQSSLDIIAGELPGGSRARRFLDLAIHGAERGAAVTGRLLSFARRGDPWVGPVSPVTLLSDLAEMLRPALSVQIDLRLDAACDPPPLLADRWQLETVLVNLVNNARDAMPEGGSLTLRADAATVPGTHNAPGHLAPGDYVRLVVADTGAGIPPELLARVSEPFFSTKRQGQGTGLGLAMAKSFAEQSGGALSIDSRVGEGTIVALWLPRVAGAEPAAPGGRQAAVPVSLGRS